MATLRLVPASGSPIEITRDKVVVGRDPGCDIVLPDGSVSRKHAYLEKRAAGWFVVDQGSANGTFLDSRRVAEEPLHKGQEIRFGALSFRVDVTGDEDPSATVAGHPQPEVTVMTPSLTPPPAAARKPAPPPRPTAPLPQVPAPPPSAGQARERFRAAAPPTAGAPAPAGGAAPVPQMPAEPAPAKKGRGPFFWITTGCCGCLLLVLLLIALGAGGLFFMTKGAADAVRAELDEVKAGHLDRAYAALSPSYQSQLPFRDFERFVSRHPGLRDNADSTFYSRSVNNNTATISGTLTSTSGKPEAVTFRLIREDGTWKITAIEFEGEGTTSGELAPPALPSA